MRNTVAFLAFMLTVHAVSAEPLTLDADEVIQRYHFYDLQCHKGDGGEQGTWEFCGARRAYGEMLLMSGYCFDDKSSVTGSTWVKGPATDEGVCQQ
jgi:hypothetical protein